MPFYSFNFILLVVCAGFFYRAGEFERRSGLTWAGLSILISLAMWILLRGGFFSVLFGQVGLYIGITLYRYWREPPGR
jgi:hypothetical protein